jgi:hypothetical protein
MARGSPPDAVESTSSRMGQHVIAYEWAQPSAASPAKAGSSVSSAAANAANTTSPTIGDTLAGARLEVLLRPWPLLPGRQDAPLRRFPIEPGLLLFLRLD